MNPGIEQLSKLMADGGSQVFTVEVGDYILTRRGDWND